MHDIYCQGFTNAKCINRPKLALGVFAASNMVACCPPPLGGESSGEEIAVETRRYSPS